MTITAARGFGVAGLNSPGMQASIVGGVRVGMAVAAFYGGRGRIMRDSLDVSVATGAVEIMVNRVAEALLVNMKVQLFTGNFFGQGCDTMACKTVGVRHLALGDIGARRRGCAETLQNAEAAKDKGRGQHCQSLCGGSSHKLVQ